MNDALGIIKPSSLAKSMKFLLKINSVIKLDPSNTLPINVGFGASIITCYNFKQPLKAYSPILFTCAGRCK